LVVVIDETADSVFQLACAAVNAAPDLFFGQLSEPALDQIEPGSRGGSEVQVEARTLGIASSLDMCRALPCQNADIASIAMALYLSLMRLSQPPTDPRLLKIHSLIWQPIGKRRAFLDWVCQEVRA
jgi:hypothetical protein